MILPRPPAAEMFTSDPRRWARELEEWARKFAGTMEDEYRTLSDPPKAIIALANLGTGVTTATISMDGTTTDVATVRDYLLSLVSAMIQRGFLRTKSGAS